MAAESSYVVLCLVIITTAMVLVLVYEEERCLTSNAYTVCGEFIQLVLY